MSNVAAIKAFIIEEFLPDVAAASLQVDYDLLAGGVIDSLGLLKLIAWVEDRFSVPIGDEDLDPDNFRSVSAIDRFVDTARVGPAVGA
ncbi:Acyl carrier protein [Actinokineospora alba]|uniref:Acyl carrier protein n=1 Tax=Actinokineospora alba TaxID=504798 RepID=A0A1H0M7V7_9PSEU|nr:phosphopantetheine-binding protein [Actinokineospora alba]TDP67620.1 acyl carrier protein [Actinokineospora alba]SDI44339.1 Acyl carrier protein [Actinokineospora alba]SDO76494.1 Acyl carrier protein [Actinokineospora alba]